MILSAEHLAWYRNKETILLDGAFDPLHVGHLQYVSQATRMFPSHLKIVSVASDGDIRAKGREPLFDQETRCKLVAALKSVDLVLPKDEATEIILGRLRPTYYVKGKDWEGQIPPEQATACSLYGIPIIYLDTVTDSSSSRLRQWGLRDAERGLDRLEAFIAGQVETPPERFDAEYFTGNWRGEEGYTWEARRAAEGRHPKIVKECFEGLTVLDVGCGPGHFVRMLREVGMDAGGIDPSRDAVRMSNGIQDRIVCGDVAAFPAKMAHVCICREVLEHLTVHQITRMVADLFRVARKYVYITTRYSTQGIFDAETDFETDPTHITCLSQPFLRSLCVLNGGKRRKDLEEKLDWQKKGRCLVYEVTR